MQFPVAIHKEDGTVFGVTVPDVPGCHSWGESIEEALSNTQEAIYAHIETLLELGESTDIAPSNIQALMGHGDYDEAIWAMVYVDMSELDPKPERVNISLPRFVLSKIDRYAKSNHETRSGFIARAAMKELSHV